MIEWNIYLSGEIHSNWREEIKKKIYKLNLPVNFTYPVLNHTLSDDCGAEILGLEDNKFWHDHKSAKINLIRTKTFIDNADLVVVRFGEKYKQWNAAFDAGYAIALSKPIIVIHNEENQHALKEVDAAALAVVKDINEVVKILKYTINGNL